jgi:hypothetical protein
MHSDKQDPRDRLQQRLDMLENEESWRPEQVPDTLAGPILALETRHTEPRPGKVVPCPVVIVEADGKARSFWGFHTVARSQLAALKPQVGDYIAIRYLGTVNGGSGQSYVNYKIIVDRDDGGTYDWSKVDVEGGDVPPDANVLGLQEKEKAPTNPLVEEVDPALGF